MYLLFRSKSQQTRNILALLPGKSKLPGEALDEREEAEGLRQAIAHYKASPGPVVPHVLLGPLIRSEWDRFHCIHAAHHLSFAVPKAPPH